MRADPSLQHPHTVRQISSSHKREPSPAVGYVSLCTFTWSVFIHNSLSIQTLGTGRNTMRLIFSWPSWQKRVAMTNRGTGFHLVLTSRPAFTVWCTTAIQFQSLKIVSFASFSSSFTSPLNFLMPHIFACVCSSSHSTGKPVGSHWQQKPSSRSER